MALFGGTFDPIHDAHLTVAREAADRFALDRVVFVPAGNPPHKTGSTSAAYSHRFRMVELACAGEPRFEVSPIEAGQEMSYTLTTIERTKAHLAPGDALYFLIGADAFADIGTWHRAADVLRSVDFIVVTRPGHQYAEPPGARVERLETVALPVSSSDIREQLAQGRTPAQLTDAVLNHIRANRLYGA